MLYHETGKDIVRLQGAFVDTPEIKRVLKYIIDNNGKAQYNPEVMYALQQETDKLNKAEKKVVQNDDYAVDGTDPDFELLCQATELVIQMGGGISKNIIQRHLKVGFNRSANIFDKLVDLGFISQAQGNPNKPRDVLVTWEQYQQWKNNNGK
jgi:S-DNA-T family DNA segregation ATPase FtsK/SpoIIIE